MKLYEVPRNTMIRYFDGTKESEFLFHHVDGMYSYCTDKGGHNVFHLSASSVVELLIDKESNKEYYSIDVGM